MSRCARADRTEQEAQAGRGRQVRFGGVFAVVLAAGSVFASDQAGIAAQPLTTALTEFAERTGLQLVYSSDLTAGLATKGAAPGASVREALDQLLAGASLSYRFINERTVTIEPRSTARGDATMTTDAMAKPPTLESQKPSFLRRLVAVVAGVGLAAPLGAEQATGDDAAAGDQEQVVEEIVVTATYRDTQLMNTPIAITAVTDIEIVQKGMQDIHTLYTSIPGFNYKSSTLAYNILSVRGITPFAGGPSPVGAYMDNVPIGSTRGDSGHLRGALFDIERVEVLKGPQGTLYGEGAMGGAIRYITKQPDPEGFDFSGRATFETMAHSSGIGHRIDGMLNVPLSERAAARLVLYSRDQKGLIDAPGLRNEKDVNWTKETGGRLTVALEATDDLRLTAMVNQVSADMGAPGIAFHCYDVLREDVNLVEVPDYPSPGVNCRGDHNAQFARDPYVTHKTHPAVRGLDGGIDDTTIFNLGAEWELPFADLIASASHLDQEWQYDEEAPPHVAFLKGLVERANCFGALGDGICNVPGRYSSQIVYNLVHRWTDRYAYEMRLVSTGEGPLQWTVGAYYKDDDFKRGDHSPCSPLVPYAAVAPEEHCFIQWLFHPDTPVEHQAMIANWLNTTIFPGNSSFGSTQEKSLFGEVSYRLNDQWEVTAGLRSADVIVSVNTLLDGSDDPRDIESSFTLDDDRKTSPKVTLTWRPADDWMIYGTWSHGFRPGIVQDRLISAVARLDAVRANNADAEALYQELVDAQTVNGDEAVSIELGLKATLADGRLSVTGALYNIDWEDIIVRTSATTPNIPGIVPFPLTYDDNAGTASSQGLELELRGIFADAWSWALGGSFMWEADIGSASTGNVARVAGSTSVGVQPGNRLPASPEFSGYASLVRDFQLGGFNATARADAYKVTEQFRGGDNERATPGYETMDLRLLMARDSYEFSFYVRNVFDEVVAYERNQQGYVFGRARTFGVEFNYNP